MKHSKRSGITMSASAGGLSAAIRFERFIADNHPLRGPSERQYSKPENQPLQSDTSSRAELHKRFLSLLYLVN